MSGALAFAPTTLELTRRYTILHLGLHIQSIGIIPSLLSRPAGPSPVFLFTIIAYSPVQSSANINIIIHACLPPSSGLLLLPNPLPRPHSSQTTLIFHHNLLISKPVFLAKAAANTTVCRIDGQFAGMTLVLRTLMVLICWWEVSNYATRVAAGESVGWDVL